jgi:hypothetical protein
MTHAPNTSSRGSTPLFEQLLGEAFGELPPSVIALHRRQGAHTYRGEVDVVRGHRVLSRFCAWATALPPAGEGPVEVDIVAESGRECWTRRIGRHAMRSRLWAQDALLCERLGLVEFGFRLIVEQGEIVWRAQRVRVLGVVPLPRAWFAGVEARESSAGGCYRFDVRAQMPLIGLLVHYRGWLEPV